MSVVLATTVHDPGGRMVEQTARALPVLREIFAGIAAQATHAASERTLRLLHDAGAHVRQDTAERFAGYMKLGQPRRDAVALALQSDGPFIMLCDFDRVIHWAEFYPDELATVVARLPARDFTVLGRTGRAFASHPRVQRDTESIINHVFAMTSGKPWDITAAARGLSRRAAEAILSGCPDESIGTDASWPLFVQRVGGFSMSYIATEGLEFETADRFGDEVAAAGGVAQWIARMDADPRNWAQRLEMARLSVAAMLPYSAQGG
jgi:hypothetical protein